MIGGRKLARHYLMASVAGAALLTGGVALADTLTPDTVMGSIGVGGTFDITDKVGTISAGTPTTAQADVLFVIDTTGSMSAGIGAVESALSGTVAGLSAFGNIATGAAQYKDKTSAGDPFDYSLAQSITTTASLTETAIGSFTASGGGDTPEQGLFALSQGATNASTAWRAGSKRVEVIVGDAPSHSSPSHPPAAGGVGVASVATDLISSGVTMIVLDANPLTHGDGGLDAYGQFSALLTDGVSGPPVAGFTTSTDITNEIVAAVGSSFATYSDVSLGLVGPAPSDCSVSLPTDITGSFDRSISRMFDFGNVGVTGTHAGTCSFTVGLFADGALLATEADTISVTGPAVPEASTWAMMLLGFAGIGYLGYGRRAKARLAS